MTESGSTTTSEPTALEEVRDVFRALLRQLCPGESPLASNPPPPRRES